MTVRFSNTKPHPVSRLQWLSVACLLFVMAQMAGLATIAVGSALIFISNPSNYTLTVIVAPIVEESMKAIMFLLFLRYRDSLGVQTTDAQMIFAALWIGASFGFYEWSIKELATYLWYAPSLPHAIITAGILGLRMLSHGGFTVWMGITYWFGRTTGRPKLAVLPGLVIAVLFHMAYNALTFYPYLGFLIGLPVLVGFLTIIVVIIWYPPRKNRLRNCNEKH